MQCRNACEYFKVRNNVKSFLRLNNETCRQNKRGVLRKNVRVENIEKLFSGL